MRWLALLLLLPLPAMAQDLASICLSNGSPETYFVGQAILPDDSVVWVSTPDGTESPGVIRRWREPGIFADYAAILGDALAAVPDDLLARCDEGWRDTIVLRYADGRVLRRDASCGEDNPVVLLGQEINLSRQTVAGIVFTEEPLPALPDGAHDICGRDW